MADKKTYPDNKKRRAGRKTREAAGGVYAGPGFFKRRKEDADAVFEEVYAGPDFFEGRGIPTGDPEDAPEPPMIEAVYAGPEFFERDPEEPDRPEQEPTSAPAPEEDREVPPPPPPMMCVYAGPDYFAGRRTPSPAPAANQDGKKRYCPDCGTPAEKGDNFCRACGAGLSHDGK